MSCLNLKLKDIEDIYTQRDSKFINIMTTDYDKYKLLVTQLYNHTLNNINKDYNIVKKEFTLQYGKLSRQNGLSVKKPYLVYVYRRMLIQNEIENNELFWTLIQKCPSRNISGINSFAVLLSPHPHGQKFSCKHDCFYCPDESIKNGAEFDVARSYLLKEPAVQRGHRNNWDPQKQIVDRLNSLMMQGHEIDKLEIIIEGGTYTEFPKQYLIEFNRDLFYSANTYFDSLYDKRPKKPLKDEINYNIHYSKVKIIGICIETRPDTINKEWIHFFRIIGVTRVQLGVQHTDNNLLNKINRGHTFGDSCHAVKILKNNCFKVDIHLMPDLPDSSPEKDKKMFDIIFKTSLISPDAVKIYPCEVTPYTRIEKWYKQGKFMPYSEQHPEKLVDVVKYALETCPYWIRIARVVRDIPINYITAGNRYSNLRQMLTDKLELEGKYCKDLRTREIGRNLQYSNKYSFYKIRRYRDNFGIDYFISLESWDSRALFGFIRLRIPTTHKTTYYNTLKNKGLIRELHVYNRLVPVGHNKQNSSQHVGIGKTLVKIAEYVSYFHKMNGVAIISGEGVRMYYRKLGYKTMSTFEVKMFKTNITFFLNIFFLVFLVFLVVNLY